MSVPYTGRLVAEIRGERCLFDGNSWETPDPSLTRSLNEATAGAPKHHHTIDSVARYVFWTLGLEAVARITAYSCDSWPEDIPPGAVD